MKWTRSLACLLLACPAWAGMTHAADKPDPTPASLDDAFRSPPQVARPRVWWDWLNGNVNAQAIQLDLADMKRVGIGGLQMRDINPRFPKGPVRYGTDDWFACLKTAIQTCDKLGLDFGMHNTPGWSGSGGPFVPVEDSMKKIVFTELPDVHGHVAAMLAQPATNFNFYRDIAVVAVPADPIDDVKPVVSSTYKDADINLLVDGKVGPDSAITFPKTANAFDLTFTYDKPVQRRLLTMYSLFQRGEKVTLNGTIEASDDGKTFRKIRTFSFPGQLQAHIGFIGTDPVLTAPFDAETARVFRVTFKGQVSPPLAELQLSDSERIENYNTKICGNIMGGLIPPADMKTVDPDAIKPDRVIDVTAFMKADGTLDWTAPAGRWAILRFGYTTTGIPNHPAQPEGEGFEVDKMDAAAVDQCFDHALGRVLQENAGSIGKSFTNIYTDSWEAGQQNWCADFAQQFKRRRGYDLLPYLPIVSGRVVGSVAESEAFLIDFRRTIGELIAANYHGEMSKLAAQHGLHYYSEAYGGKAFSESRSAAVSEQNMAEFWYTKDRSHLSVAGVKRTASIAHALGRNVIAAESFTTVAQEASFQADPYLLKAVGDLALVNGLTQTYFHSYSHQPYEAPPGLSMGSTGTNFGRFVTWWSKSAAWMDYLARCQFMLQQGLPVSDVLCFKMNEIGSFVAERYPDLPAGFDYDLADDVYLAQATARDGVLTLPSGRQYRALVLPATWWGDLACLQRLGAIADAGVPVIGPPPHCVGSRNDLQHPDQWQAAIDKLWPKSDGKLPSPTTDEVSAIFAKHQLQPDCVITGAESEDQINYLHHRIGETEIYFLCNRSEKPATLDVDFRVSGKQPELWDAVTGQIAPIRLYTSQDGRTKISVTLGDTGSIFVVFRAAAPPVVATAVTQAGQPLVLGRDYRLADDGSLILAHPGPVQFQLKSGGQQSASLPAAADSIAVDGKWAMQFQPMVGDGFSTEADKLQSWADNADEKMKYFSGTVTYHTSINVPGGSLRPDERCLLDLGKVCDVANVRVNGKAAATLWTPPFATDVTSLLVPGSNTIEIDVTNRWINRLMGDGKLPQDAAYQNKPSRGPSWGILDTLPDWLTDPAKIRARQRSTFVSYSVNYKPGDELPVSGLLGPVVARFEPVVSIPVK